MAATKLHELLAVDSNLKGQAHKTRTELGNTFSKKSHLFSEKRVTHTFNETERPDEIKEQTTLQSKVTDEITWITGILAKAFDVSFAIDMANTVAKADIILEDATVLAKNVPATALLQLEKRVKEVLELIKQIPTLDPAKGFETDAARGKGVYKAREIVNPRTEKVQEWKVIVPATDKFPAQAQQVTQDVRIGHAQTLEWSSLITPATKADLLERGEAMLRAVSQARARANEVSIDTAQNKIGKQLLDYIFKPVHV